MRVNGVHKNCYSILAHCRVIAFDYSFLCFLVRTISSELLDRINQTSILSLNIMRGSAVHKNCYSILAHYRVIAVVSLGLEQKLNRLDIYGSA